MSAATPNPLPSAVTAFPTHPLLSPPHLLILANLAIIAVFAGVLPSLSLANPTAWLLAAGYALLVVRTDPVAVLGGRRVDRKAGVEGEKGLSQVGAVGRLGVGVTTGFVAWLGSGWVMNRI